MVVLAGDEDILVAVLGIIGGGEDIPMKILGGGTDIWVAVLPGGEVIWVAVLAQGEDIWLIIDLHQCTCYIMYGK